MDGLFNVIHTLLDYMNKLVSSFASIIVVFACLIFLIFNCSLSNIHSYINMVSEQFIFLWSTLPQIQKSSNINQPIFPSNPYTSAPSTIRPSPITTYIHRRLRTTQNVRN